MTNIPVLPRIDHGITNLRVFMDPTISICSKQITFSCSKCIYLYLFTHGLVWTFHLMKYCPAKSASHFAVQVMFMT